jgi:hypothetical protein
MRPETQNPGRCRGFCWGGKFRSSEFSLVVLWDIYHNVWASGFGLAWFKQKGF